MPKESAGFVDIQRYRSAMMLRCLKEIPARARIILRIIKNDGKGVTNEHFQNVTVNLAQQ